MNSGARNVNGRRSCGVQHLRCLQSLLLRQDQAMVPIMQADGTMKMETRSGDRNQTDSTAGYGPARKANLSRANRNL